MHIVTCKNDKLYFENQKDLEPKTKKTNSVKRSNILSKNEIQISEIIRQIPLFFLNFGPILNYRDFKLAEIDDEKFERCRMLNNEYFLFQYENREKMQDFGSFFLKSATTPTTTTKKQKIIKIIHSFKNLLQLIKKMNEKNLVNTNLVPTNILFKHDETPYLINFDQCITLSKEQDERKNIEDLETVLFFEYNPRKIHLPIEVHLLCFINAKNLESLSAGNIETVVNDLLNTASLSPFGKYITDEFKAAAIFSQRGLINKPKNWIKREILSFSCTWNNYSLSIAFLHLLSSLDEESRNHKFLNGFIHILLQNISGDSAKREAPDKTLEIFDDLVYSISQNEWSAFF
jgi:hypothetical protein